MDETDEKTKKVFYKCVLVSHFTTISGRKASFCQKKVHIVVPYTTHAVLANVNN
jgi:hypothetical protein